MSHSAAQGIENCFRPMHQELGHHTPDRRTSTQMPPSTKPTSQTAASEFFRKLHSISSLGAGGYDGRLTPIYRSIARVYFFITAGRVLWSWFDPGRRQSLLVNWRRQAHQVEISDLSQLILTTYLNHLEGIMGEEQPETNLGSLYIDEQELNPHLKHEMFNSLLKAAQGSARGSMKCSDEWRSLILGVLYDAGGSVDDVYEVICLTRVMFPGEVLLTEASSRWSTFVEDLEEQLQMDGYSQTLEMQKIEPLPSEPGQLSLRPQNLRGSASDSSTTLNAPDGSAPGSIRPSPIAISTNTSNQVGFSVQDPDPAPLVNVAASSTQINPPDGVQEYRSRFTTRSARLEVKISADLQKLEIADVESDWESWHGKLHNALKSSPVNGNTKETAAAKSFHKKLASTGGASEDLLLETADSILAAVVNLHRHGTPLRVDERETFRAKNDRDIRAADLSYGIKNRLNQIIPIIRQNKRVALECVFTERTTEFLAWAPGVMLARRSLWAQLNLKKATKLKDLEAKVGTASSGNAVTHQDQESEQDSDVDGEAEQDAGQSGEDE
ncbi:uncharacterized protein RCC_09918 [Ramularia collo-cygni]|uniref:Uncharacterized protein n=1 Tax=Ramularia collo-cygni TaxID=112498 RepID=A0A2D3VIQ8_9PEZI|nr:uncharacterized protein RCC_09918 [Ramularia collo-cygni]CZT24201.1 uncharacterized protein RCC_09918 [Ramularia collo-cygni]